jgi:hypothetical protein
MKRGCDSVISCVLLRKASSPTFCNKPMAAPPSNRGGKKIAGSQQPRDRLAAGSKKSEVRVQHDVGCEIWDVSKSSV